MSGRPLYRTAIAAACIGLAAFAAGSGSGESHSGGGGSSLPPPAQLDSPPLHPPLPLSANFEKAVEAHLAGRLHSSVAALGSQLRAMPGATLTGMGKPLGYSQDQLAAIVRQGLVQGTDATARSAGWSDTNVRKENRYWNAQSDPALIAEVSRWLVHG